MSQHFARVLTADTCSSQCTHACTPNSALEHLHLQLKQLFFSLQQSCICLPCFLDDICPYAMLAMQLYLQTALSLCSNGKAQSTFWVRLLCSLLCTRHEPLVGVLLLVPQLLSLEEPPGRPNVRSFELTNGPARLKAKLLARRRRRSRLSGSPLT